MIAAPVFLVGSERSGTTLLRLMLDHHPRVALNFESDYLATQVSGTGAHPATGRYRDWLRHDRAFRHSGFVIDERLDFVGLVNDFLEQKRRRDRKELVGATVHHQFSKLPWIWPEAKFVYLLRDGRDVSNSAMKMGWAGNLHVAADVWLEAERERDLARARAGAGNWLEVRYEDLVADAERELRRICAFVGTEFNDAMFDYVKDSTYEAPDASLCYQWRSNLRQPDVQVLEEKLGGRLLERGYALSGYPRIRLSWAKRKWLRLHSRLGAYRFRLTRYGVSLTLQETLARRLGLDRLHRTVSARIDAITDIYMK